MEDKTFFYFDAERMKELNAMRYRLAIKILKLILLL